MNSILQTWQLMLLGLAAWVNREQQARIEYLQTEVTVLKEQIGKKRILLTDYQRRAWQSRARRSVARLSTKLALCSRQIRFSAGIVAWLPETGTTRIAKRRDRDSQRSDKWSWT